MKYANMKSKTCPICGKEFRTLNVLVKYCSPKCSREGREKSIEKNRKKYEIQNKLKFGLNKDTPLEISFKCKNCRTKFTRKRSQVASRGAGYCSVECRYEGQKNKKPGDQQLIDLWAKAVKIYDSFRCAYCGKTTNLNSHHIFSRSNKSTRYDLHNGITLCVGCHTFSSKFSAHKTPVEFVEWIKEKRGIEWYENLRTRARQVTKLSKEDLVAIRDNLKDIVRHYDDGEFT